MSIFSYTPPQKILQTAGYRSPQLLQDGGNWRLWTATFQEPARDRIETILFLGHNSRLDDVIAARNQLRGKVNFARLVVIARNAAHLNLDHVRGALGAESVISVKDLLLNVVGRSLGESSEVSAASEDYGLEYFIDPFVHFPAWTDDQPGTHFLQEWLVSPPSKDHNVAVILAPAGVGKSTLAVEIFRRLQRLRQLLLPLLVNSELWRPGLQVEERGLTGIWASAISNWYRDALVGPERVDTCLACGTICPIFDGLDELCSLFPSEFSASETLRQLLETFSDGRLLLTSRNVFWEENVAPEIRAEVLEIDLRPFTTEQRRTYVINRYKNEPNKQAQAFLVFDRLVGKIGAVRPSGAGAIAVRRPDRIDLVPYVVMLATESVTSDESGARDPFGPQFSADDPLESLLLAFCRREQGRHRLPINPTGQIELFEALATEYPGGFGEPELALALELYGPTGETPAVERIVHHAFLRPETGKSSRFVFRFPFVPEYLLARAVAKWFSSCQGTVRTLRELSGFSGAVDRAAELIVGRVGRDWERRARDAWGSLSSDHPAARANFFQLAVRLARLTAEQPRENLTSLLIAALGDVEKRILSGLDLGGSVSGLDLSDMAFERCAFRDFEWITCKFDELTVFRHCRFEGTLRFTNCSEVDRISWDLDTCTFSLLARAAIQERLAAPGRLPVTDDQIRGWVADVLRRFRRGAVAFVTRKEEGVRGSTNQVTKHGNRVIDALISHGVFARFTNDRRKMLKVAAGHDVRVFLENGSVVGSVKAAVDDLHQALVGR